MPTETTATVSNVQRYSLHDGGGIRTVVFLKGCPFRCPWCANPENLNSQPEVWFKPVHCMGCSEHLPGERLCVTPPELCPTRAKELVGERMTADQVLAHVVADQAFYQESGGGITVSGGEPLLWQDFVAELFEAAHEHGLETALETTLAVEVPQLEKLARVCDRWLVDFKIFDRDQSRSITGIDLALRDKNARYLLGVGGHVVARMPLVPGYTADPEVVAANLDHIAELGIREVDFLPFHQLGSSKYQHLGLTYTMADVPQLTDSDVAFALDLAHARGLAATLRG